MKAGARLIGLAVGFLIFATVHVARAEHTRVTNPNSLNIELLGRGLLWSMAFDRVMNDDMAAGVGYGSVTTKDGTTVATMIPVYMNYYFTRDQGSFYGTGGVTILTNATQVNGKESNLSATKLEFSSSPVMPVVGFGYENRGDFGFLFRATAYGILAKTFSPWVGFTFGYAF